MSGIEKGVAAATVGIVVIWAAFWGALIYVAWHFISKMW